MNRLLQGSEDSAVRYLRHLLRNGSFYPITTFFLAACVVVWMTWIHLVNHTHGAMILGIVAVILLVISDKRDRRAANASFESQLEAVRKLVFSSAEMASAVATVRNDHQEASMHAQDISIAQITDKDAR